MKEIQNEYTHNIELIEKIPELSLKKNLFGHWAKYFIKNYRVTFLLIGILLFWGVSNGLALQREAEPKVTIPLIIVSTGYTGASPEEVENLITNPIEKKLKEIEDVDKVSSTSGAGYSSITLQFLPGIVIKDKLRDVQQKVNEIEGTLPEGVDAPNVTDVKTGDNPAVLFTMTGNEDISTLQKYAENLEEKITELDGVKNFTIYGDIERQILIEVDPKKLATYGIALTDIRNALAASNISFPGGDVKLNEKYYNVRTVGEFKTIEEIADTVITHGPNGYILLKDIAKVLDGYKDQDMMLRRFERDGEDLVTSGNTIILSITKTQLSDDIVTRDAIVKLVNEEKGNSYPEDVELFVYSDKAKDVENQLGSLVFNAISGLCLVIVVLYIFIGFGESVVVSTTIPISIFVALGLMKWSGMTLNMVSLFSLLLAVGMLVDNAIVVMENINRIRQMGVKSQPAAIAATNQIAPAVFSSTLTTLAAFFPLSLTSGIMGDYIKSIPATIIFTLTASFFVSITTTPMMSSLFLRAHKKAAEKPKRPTIELLTKIFSVLFVFALVIVSFMDFSKDGLEKITPLALVGATLFATIMAVKQFKKSDENKDPLFIRLYTGFLSFILDKVYRKIIFLLCAVAVFVVSVMTIPLGILKVEMFGADDFPTLYVNIKAPPGSTLEATERIVKEAEEKVKGVKEIQGIVSFSGHGGIDFYNNFDNDNATSNLGKLIIQLSEMKDRNRKSMEIANEIRTLVKPITGAEVTVSELSAGPPSDSPITLLVKGNNMEDIQKTTEDLTAILEEVPGSRDVKNSIGILNPEIQINVDKKKASSFGLDNQSIAFSIRNVLNDLNATKYRINQDEIDVIIKTQDDSLNTINDIDKINFYSRKGITVPFEYIAEKTEGESKKAIFHEDRKRYMSISSGVVDGLTSNEVVLKLEEKLKTYPFKEGVTYEFGGENEMMGTSFNDMMINMVVAVIIVFIILTIQFSSLSQPFIILMTVPLSLIGVVGGLLISGYNFGFLSFVGVVALVGIAVNNGILLIDYINYLRAEGLEMKEAILKTGKTRMIPVFATTITTAGGILPISLGDPFFAPLGITLMSGLCVSTLLTLLVIPTFYMLSENFKSAVYGLFKRFTSSSDISIPS
jgi:hydrophobic/amphiphilic exporter-1 (mainly G- bacteria), HAE1 family